MYWVDRVLYFWNTGREEVFHPLNVDVMWIGSLMRVSWSSVDLTCIGCGFRPNFIDLMDCASVAVYVLMAFASIS